MPTYSVTGPDGKIYSIDGPSGATQDQVVAAIKAHMGQAPAAPAPAPQSDPGLLGTAWDAIRSIPGGLAQGVAATAGMAGDVRKAVTSVLPQNVASAVNAVGSVLPQAFGGGQTSDEYNAMLSAPTGGYYKPKTDAGRFAETAASFAPAVVGGPESLGTRVLQRAVLPAAGATIGRKVGGDTGEFLGTLAGGLTPTGVEAAASRLGRVAPKIPSIADLKAAAQSAYNTVDNSGMVIAAPAVQNMVNGLKAKLTQMGIHPQLQPRAMAAFNTLENAAQNNQTLQGMEVLKRVANQAADTLDRSDKAMSRIVGDHIDNFVENLGPSDVIGNVDKPALDALGTARDMWARASKANLLETMMTKAKNRAEVVGGSGLENAIRIEFRKLAQSDRGMARFNPAEQDAIRRVARGGPMTNVARLVGKLAPTNMLAIMAEGGAALMNPALAAVPAAGLAGRGVATALTQRAARQASELIRNGGPVVQPRTALPNTSPLQLGRSLAPLLLLPSTAAAQGQ